MITAVVMVGEGNAGSERATWVQGARRAAARDLVEQLTRQPLVEKVLLLSPEPVEATAGPDPHYLTSLAGPIHLGQQLARLVAEEEITHLLYFGGGSAPLLSDDTLTATVNQLAAADRLVITNNRYASDWAAVTPAPILADWVSRLPRDNMLGWVLSAEAGLPLQAMPPSAASRLDIDTPLDLQLLRLHPRTKPYLRRYLNDLPLETQRLQAVVSVLATPATRVFIAGRISPDVWSALNRVTQSWLRVVSEERGMVSSGRQARGEARSLLAAHVEAVGMDAFFTTLADWADAALIDTRVLLAHHGRWPDADTRFASDLGQVDHVVDEWLRALTAHALAAPIPILLGGHGLVAGDLYAICDLLEAPPG
ncbi:MAG: hypothetical protein R3248_09000 [Candidatus Promineifilaceae bacterium]|nr:hypothetical protein [Candidatus Promineifilaceae bacterium]